jgi:hypothetical protein
MHKKDMKHQFTHAQQAFIKLNYLLKSSNELGRHCGCTGQVIRRFLKENNLIVPKEVSQSFRGKALTGRTTFNKKEDAYIKRYYLTKPIKQIAATLKRSGTGINSRLRQLGLVIPADVIEQRKKDSRIQPGNVPPNAGRKQSDYMTPEAIARTAATRFQKGNIPHNTKEADGEISIRAKKGDPPYKYIRVSLGKWVLLQRHNWEKVHGPIPKGHCLWCLGDTLNCEPDNWELITRKENRIRNSGTRNLSDVRVATYLATASRSVDRNLKEIVINHPELITAKRNQLLINRKIKQHGQKQNNRP